jgi:hypothetical protein
MTAAEQWWQPTLGDQFGLGDLGQVADPGVDVVAFHGEWMNTGHGGCTGAPDGLVSPHRDLSYQ